MPLPGIDIRERPSPPDFAATRADIALFVGLVARRGDPLPDHLAHWLAQSDYSGSGPLARSPDHIEALLDVPVPVESWDMFDQLFAWDERPVEAGSAELEPCRLGLAVRSFFEEGGAKAYIVRLGDPLPVLDPDEDRTQAIQRFRDLIAWNTASAPDDATQRAPLLPGFGDKGRTVDAHDPASWSGAGHIYGMEDAALLLMPDLPELISGPARIEPAEFVPDGIDEQFVDCAPPIPGASAEPRAPRGGIVAPRLDADGYAQWRAALAHALKMLDGRGGASHRRDVMLISSMPLPDLNDTSLPPIDRTLENLHGASASSARLQLAWPWVKTPSSSRLAEGLEGGEGLLAGAIARTTLMHGAHAPAAGPLRTRIYATQPALSKAMLRESHADAAADWLGASLSLIGLKAGRMSLLSDATTSASPDWQAGSVSRLMASLLRNARTLGQELFFDVSGEESWSRLRREITKLLMAVWNAGTLRGNSPNEAFQVACDRSTMTQYDIDNGRLIAMIEIWPAQLIERINVELTVTEGNAK